MVQLDNQSYLLLLAFAKAARPMEVFHATRIMEDLGQDIFGNRLTVYIGQSFDTVLDQAQHKERLLERTSQGTVITQKGLKALHDYKESGFGSALESYPQSPSHTPMP